MSIFAELRSHYLELQRHINAICEQLKHPRPALDVKVYHSAEMALQAIEAKFKSIIGQLPGLQDNLEKLRKFLKEMHKKPLSKDDVEHLQEHALAVVQIIFPGHFNTHLSDEFLTKTALQHASLGDWEIIAFLISKISDSQLKATTLEQSFRRLTKSNTDGNIYADALAKELSENKSFDFELKSQTLAAYCDAMIKKGHLYTASRVAQWIPSEQVKKNYSPENLVQKAITSGGTLEGVYDLINLLKMAGKLTELEKIAKECSNKKVQAYCFGTLAHGLVIGQQLDAAKALLYQNPTTESKDSILLNMAVALAQEHHWLDAKKYCDEISSDELRSVAQQTLGQLEAMAKTGSSRLFENEQCLPPSFTDL